jgi:adenylate cyclase
MTDHAAQALKAARGMVTEIDRLNRELIDAGQPGISVGIGLDTGYVVMGHVGSERRLEFTLIGVPVNNSSYLSKVRPARVLMSETTRDLLPAGFEVSDYEPMLLKGAIQPQAIYQLEITVTAES